ncbi:hypothetical protein NDU88_001970 [Pleurodeles waltl]|uniref:Uncharacterized protein n=1 Tax=Pleurodeles waltl TaxID=8319 RepID=A0AAV7KRM7_PLEWA|nr:hypothetical protein NDU88_001970 [Pleurodeles waltl]
MVGVSGGPCDWDCSGSAAVRCIATAPAMLGDTGARSIRSSGVFGSEALRIGSSTELGMCNPLYVVISDFRDAEDKSVVAKALGLLPCWGGK